MMLSGKLQMRQSQSLVMTPQLLQSIRLLQFSHAELAAFVEAEVERNPLLAIEDAAGGDAPGRPLGDPGETPAGEDFDRSASAPAESDERVGNTDFEDPYGDGPYSDGSEAGRDNLFPGQGLVLDQRGGAPAAAALAAGGPGGEAPSIEDLAAGKPSLILHALSEIADTMADPEERRIAERLAEHLDEAGYLRLDLAAAADELGCETATARAVLARLQRAAEPAGLFARDLAECLKLQVERQGRLDPAIAGVLDNLDLLARRDFAALRRLTGEDEGGLMEILAEIRRLDPKPGHGFAAAPIESVVPEIVVRQAADGGWHVELNPARMPRVILDGTYASHVARARMAPDDRAFVAECQQSANWLIRSLDQRARTILKVATEIVRRQDGFLVGGIAGLKPLTLMAVADAVGMHESTISRVTANKYIATPRGTFELKFFFTVAIASSSGGEAHSAESVKHRIRAMIAAEGPGGVLSDDDIAERLRAEGVDLARRTVAKYREALGIASSIRRRREMNARRLAS